MPAKVTNRKMTTDSLQTLMNAIARGEERGIEEACVPVDAWTDSLESDSLLATLYKRYRNSKANYQALLKANGPDDPMAQIAQDMMESNRSAFETRLIELKRDRRCARTDEQTDIMARLDEARAKAGRLKKAKQQEAFYGRRARDRARRKAEKEGRDGMFVAWILLWLLQQSIQYSYERLKLAQVFADATLHEHEVKVA